LSTSIKFIKFLPEQKNSYYFSAHHQVNITGANIMNFRFDLKTLWKCIFTGFYLLIEGMVLQISKGILLLQKKPPALNFIIEVSIFYFITGFLFALVFFIVKNALPGKKRYTRGLFYGLLVAFGVAFGMILGVIALDFEGKFNLLTPYKIEAYFITIIDIVNFIITGMALGVIAEKKGFEFKKANFNRKGLAIASMIGLIAFPALSYLISVIIDPFIPIGINFPDRDAELLFYTGTFIPFAVNGAVIPLFYCLTKDAFTGAWKEKSTKFFLLYYFGFLVIGSLFALPFGFSLQSVIHFLMILIIPTYFIAALTAKLQN
jgi:hypothetical protein